MPIYNDTSETQKLRDLNSCSMSAASELCYFVGHQSCLASGSSSVGSSPLHSKTLR